MTDYCDELMVKDAAIVFQRGVVDEKGQITCCFNYLRKAFSINDERVFSQPPTSPNLRCYSKPLIAYVIASLLSDHLIFG